MNNVITDSLAAGIRKEEVRRLRQIKPVPYVPEGKRWLRDVTAGIEKVYGPAVYGVMAKGKGRRAVTHMHVLDEVDNGGQLAYTLGEITLVAKEYGIDSVVLPVGVTKHAVERAIQELRTIDTREVEAFLKTALFIALMLTNKGAHNNDPDTTFYVGTDWGLYILEVNRATDHLRGASDPGQGILVLKTLIRADKLDGKNLERWKENAFGRLEDSEC